MTLYIIYQLLKDHIFDNFAAGLLMTQEMKGFCYYQGDHTTASNTKNNYILYIYIYYIKSEVKLNLIAIFLMKNMF